VNESIFVLRNGVNRTNSPASSAPPSGSSSIGLFCLSVPQEYGKGVGIIASSIFSLEFLTGVWHKMCRIKADGRFLRRKRWKRDLTMEKEILTIDEAAAYLQIGKRSLYKLAKEGKIPCKKILNKWRFEKEALRAWIRAESMSHMR
jgi:excisionase family DNA binding protein